MNRGMVRVRRDLGGHQVQLLPLFKQELWEQLTQSRVSIASEHLREGEASPQYLWETCGQCLVTLTVKCLLVFSENPVFQVVLIASRPVYWEKPVSILFAPFLQVFTGIDEFPLIFLFSRLNSPSTLNLSLQGAPVTLSPLWFFTGLCRMTRCLLYWVGDFCLFLPPNLLLSHSLLTFLE